MGVYSHSSGGYKLSQCHWQSPFSASSRCWWLCYSLVYDCSLFIWPSSLCVSSLFCLSQISSIVKTLVDWGSGSSGQPCIQHLVLKKKKRKKAFAKILFPNNLTFTGFRYLMWTSFGSSSVCVSVCVCALNPMKTKECTYSKSLIRRAGRGGICL
jgi:hypothetical protein